MKKRLLSLLLVLALLGGLLPAGVLAAGTDLVKGDFIVPVRQETEVPEGYTGIYTTADLMAVAKNPGGKYILMSDVNAGSLGGFWTPIGTVEAPFTGVFNGNGHSITGLQNQWYAKVGDKIYLGLFGVISGGQVRDLKVSGRLDVVVPDKYSNSTKSKLFMGGIAACVTGSALISNCVSQVNISTDESLSKLFYADDSYGGIVGYYNGSSDGAIQYCRSMGSLSVFSEGAGIVGTMSSSGCDTRLFACRNDSTVTGTLNCAGIVSMAVAKSGTLTISSCANMGSITTREQSAGILCDHSGENVVVQDCLNTGTVKSSEAPSDAGGITARSYIPVSRCVNMGTVYGAPAGAIQGRQTPMHTEKTLSDCYWLDSGRSLIGCDGNGSMVTDRTGALSAAQMKKEESFKNFDFDTVWTLTADMDYPYPTALLGLVMENTYKSTYVEQTEAFLDGSRYVTIMGSGNGSLAGELGRAYTDAGLTVVNRGWTAINYLKNVCSFNFEWTNDFDVLLADLLMQTQEDELIDDLLTKAILANLSDMTTYVSTGFDAASVLYAEELLTNFAELPDIFCSEGEALMSETTKLFCSNAGLSTISRGFTVLGSVVSITEAVSQSNEDLLNLFVLGNAYTNAGDIFEDILVDTSLAASRVEGWTMKDHYMQQAIVNFTNDMNDFADNDPLLFFRKSGKEMLDVGTAVAGAAFDIGCVIVEVNPIVSGIRTGIGFGKSVADGLTNMSGVEYYGKMLDMAGYMAECMFLVIRDYQAAFDASGSYEDAVALDTAVKLYLDLQILACDYAIGYCTALASATLANTFNANKDDIAASVQLLVQKAELEELREKGHMVTISPSGGISGFIANCPVTVIVETKDGNEVARLATGKKTLADGTDNIYYLMGQDLETKAGFYDPAKHNLRIVGEGSGTMDLVLFSASGGQLTAGQTYLNVSVSEGDVFTPQADGTLLRNGTESILPDSEYLPNPFTDVPEGSWYHDYVMQLYREGIIKGMTATTFEPDGQLTWGQALKLLLVGTGMMNDAGTTGSDWAKPYVEKAAELGVIGTVDANGTITRLEFCTVAAKLCRLTPTPAQGFTDCTDGYVGALVEAGVINGFEEQDGSFTFRGGKTLTRAQISKIICLLLELD